MPTGRQSSIARPVARSTRVLTENVGDEMVVYDLDSKEAHCLNPLAAAVFSFADGSNTAAEIAELAAHRLARPVTEAEVSDAVAQLAQHSLLETLVAIRDGLSRRDAMRRFATVSAAAAATPLIVSILAPTAAAAQSIISTGNCCGNSATDTCTGLNSTCQSNQCCQNLGSGTCNPCKCVNTANDCSSNHCSKAINDPTCASAGGCPPVNIGGVPTAACARTSACECCYPNEIGVCCTPVASGSGVIISC